MKRVNQILTLGFLVEKLSCQSRTWLLVYFLRLLIHWKTFLSKLSWFITLQNNEVQSKLSSPYGHLNTDTPLLRTVGLVPEIGQKSYIPYLYNTDTFVKRTLGSVPLVSVLKRFDCLNYSTSFISKIACWILSKFSLVVQSVCPVVLEARNTSDCLEASSSPLLFLFYLPLNLPLPPPSTLHTPLNSPHPPPCLLKKYTERRNWSNIYKKIILNLWEKFSAV